MRPRIALLMIVITLSLAAVSRADAPTTQPDPAAATRRLPSARLGTMRRGIEAAQGELNRQDAPSADEWTQISTFSKENFPNRWQMFDRIRNARGDDAPLIQALRLRIANRYRQLKRAETDAPGFYVTALEQAKLEDKAWGLARQLQHNPADSGIRTQLHDVVTTLVNNVLAERAARLKRASEALRDEQQAYDNDRQNIDKFVNSKMNRLTSDGAEFDRGFAPVSQPSNDDDPGK